MLPVVLLCRTRISPVVYGRESSSLTSREERSLRLFENVVLRRIFGPERDEVTGEWSFMISTPHQIFVR